jgi:hypothetical protein
MAAPRCMQCQSAYFTHDRLTRYRSEVVPGGMVHFGCLADWLVDDAFRRWFGSLSKVERKAIRLRLGLPVPGAAKLLDTDTVGTKVGRSQGWVSMTQRDAMQRFRRRAKQAHEDAQGPTRDQLLNRLRKAAPLAQELVGLIAVAED